MPREAPRPVLRRNAVGELVPVGGATSVATVACAALTEAARAAAVLARRQQRARQAWLESRSTTAGWAGVTRATERTR